MPAFNFRSRSVEEKSKATIRREGASVAAKTGPKNLLHPSTFSDLDYLFFLLFLFYAHAHNFSPESLCLRSKHMQIFEEVLFFS